MQQLSSEVEHEVKQPEYYLGNLFVHMDSTKVYNTQKRTEEM